MADSQPSSEVRGDAKSSDGRRVASDGIAVIKSLLVKDIRNVHLDRWDRKNGGAQIEYADAEQIIRDWFNDGLAKRGV